ncbi:MAG: methanethiol S-methyltransferase [Gammaproteobacteria bacterium]
MLRLTAMIYGLAAYVAFFGTFVYAVGFVSGCFVPKAIDDGAVVAPAQALIANLSLLTLFALQHSVMARKRFKAWWTRYVPPAVERSTYVLLSSLALALLFWKWQPMPGILWKLEDPLAVGLVSALSACGWLIVLTSTFLINHFELFGLHQVANNLAGRPMPPPRFRTPLYYRLVRHPIYTGFIVAFWAAPTMSLGHLLFAAASTAYIVAGTLLEERDLIDAFGDEYRRYRERVRMFVPWRRTAGGRARG